MKPPQLQNGGHNYLYTVELHNNSGSSSKKETGSDAGALFVLESKGMWEKGASPLMLVLMLIPSRSYKEFFIDKDSENFQLKVGFFWYKDGWMTLAFIGSRTLNTFLA